ncbi:hypothetical protein [Psychromicrobium lacuslunae]|uniref:N-acetyltransferase domain-containing protein n=1 Tax=Psychromicrobium lacuslunae TaxID=1618207 RepID=A0A0D4C1R5_9MICC|nr:hypothetical protein [Psychromicrobium lacuslunae]AJT42612.1 hypothetical protein UM93_16090 [Psychromicrobium lacuslunae]
MAFLELPNPLPAELTTGHFSLRPIRADDAELDYQAVIETREQLRSWEQTSWPDEGFAVEDNRQDLLGLQTRHDDRQAFTYTVLDPSATNCLGCVYVFPTDAAFLAKSTVTPVSHDAWQAVQAVVYFWVRTTAVQRQLDRELLSALRNWFGLHWGFDRTVYVTSELFTQQVELIEGTDLEVKFELREPDKPGRYLIFG